MVRETTSDGRGNFRFSGVAPGHYTLTISAAGFTTWEERDIPFMGAALQIPHIVLQVGGTKSEVAVVAANDVVVPTDTGQTSTTLNKQMISQMSIAGGLTRPGAENTATAGNSTSANVQNLQRRVAGVLPIAVDVPRTGTSYRFVRPLVVDEETKVTFTYRSK
jgi:Carboxypeptidase regulatory-like domain